MPYPTTLFPPPSNPTVVPAGRSHHCANDPPHAKVPIPLLCWLANRTDVLRSMDPDAIEKEEGSYVYLGGTRGAEWGGGGGGDRARGPKVWTVATATPEEGADS